MPCASVSEKPTRVSDEYLNGGLRSVARPSSSSTKEMLSAGARRERRKCAAARAGLPAIADDAEDGPAREDDERQAEHTDGHEQPVPAELAGAPVVRVALRARREVPHRAHLGVLCAERRERRHGHERIDEPAPATDGAQVDVEDDRALVGDALARDQLELQADL